MTGRLSLLAVPAASLCTPGCPLATCCAPGVPPTAAGLQPSQPWLPVFCSLLALNSAATSCLPWCNSVLLLCSALPPSQGHITFLFLGSFVPSATLALLHQLLPAELGLWEGGLSRTDWCHWKFMGSSRGWTCSTVWQSSPLSLISCFSHYPWPFLRPLPFSLGLSPCPAFRPASDLAFYITEKIEAFNLHLLLQ